MNSVSLIGTLTDDPELVQCQTGGDVCVMRIAVPRRDRGGRREPGVVYVDVRTFGADAREAAGRLRRGDRIGLSGRIERDERTRGGERRVDQAVLIDQLDLLTPTTTDPEEKSR
jgi:single stranded DNA-binding protein